MLEFSLNFCFPTLSISPAKLQNVERSIFSYIYSEYRIILEKRMYYINKKNMIL